MENALKVGIFMLKVRVGIRVAILFSVVRYKKCAFKVTRSEHILVFVVAHICFSDVWLANLLLLLMSNSMNICWHFVDGWYPTSSPAKQSNTPLGIRWNPPSFKVTRSEYVLVFVIVHKWLNHLWLANLLQLLMGKSINSCW